MKIQTLAVIFVVIMVPIALVLSVYTQNQITTLNLQSKYDSSLIDSTHEAIKTFQLNTLANSSSDISASKIRDIEASVNSFFNSIANNFGLNEYKADTIKEYVPAIVYTLYDGYYIYSPYKNYTEGINVNQDSSSPKKNEFIQGLKPYVYYSCRYKMGNDSDFVITYTLDSYITIQGKIHGNSVNKSGYLLDNIGNNTYRGVTISTSEKLSENVINPENGKTENLNYIQENGVKYYLTGNKVFSIVNGKRVYINDVASYKNKIEKNNSAINYYKKAKEFTNWVRGDSVLSKLTFGNAVDENGDAIKDKGGNSVNGLSGNTKVFDNNTSIEDSNSNFNEHRTAVIRYSIQKNLATAISNFNNYSSSSNEFQMPNLSEEDWYSLINNVSCISFLQGLSIGGKIYNGYAVVNNNKTQEFVAEEAIYMIDNNKYYHRPSEIGLNNQSGLIGYFNVDFEKKMFTLNNQQSAYAYPHNELGSYSSIITQTNVDSEFYNNIHKNTWNEKNKNSNLLKAYYTALGRERYSMYRVNYDNYINFNTN